MKELSDKINRYNKKRNRVEKILDELELSWYQDQRDFSEHPNGFENRTEIAEKLLAEFGITKPTIEKLHPNPDTV